MRTLAFLILLVALPSFSMPFGITGQYVLGMEKTKYIDLDDAEDRKAYDSELSFSRGFIFDTEASLSFFRVWEPEHIEDTCRFQVSMTF